MGIMSLGVFVSFRILNMPDLTVDGSFALGGAACISLLVNGFSPILALIGGCICGGLAGIVTALIHRKLKINVLLAGILVMTMLYSINIRVMNGSNLPIPRIQAQQQTLSFEEETGSDLFGDLLGDIPMKVSTQEKKELSVIKISGNLFNNSQDGRDLIFLLIFSVIIIIILTLFLKTDIGTVIRGFGSNPDGVESFGIPKTFIAVIGLGIANAIVGLSGGLFALYSGFSDVTMGQGMIVTGLAIVMLGEIVVGKYKQKFGMIAPFLGGIIYQFILSLVMKYGYKIGFRASDMKILTALFIIIVIAISLLSSKKRKKSFKGEVKKLWLNLKR
jgi:putative ABC transport system permease protein